MEHDIQEPTALELAVSAVGSQSELARKIGVKPQSVQQWVESGLVPPRRVIAVETVSGVSRHLLRPDIYPFEAGQEVSATNARTASTVPQN